jgi:type III secretion protein J
MRWHPDNLSRTVAIVVLFLLCGCKTELYSALPEQEANEMVAVLLQRGIAADKVAAKDGSDTIMVDQSRFAEAVTVLHDDGYPRKTFESMGDVFKADGLVASPLQERARFLYALGQELSATISQIDGVLSARVEVVLPQDDILDRNPTPSSASVFVRYTADFGVDHLVPQLKTLVADSVQGLSYDRVSVVLVPVAHPTLPPVRVESAGKPLAMILAALAGAVVVGSIGAIGIVFRRRLHPALQWLGPLVTWRRPSAVATTTNDALPDNSTVPVSNRLTRAAS